MNAQDRELMQQALEALDDRASLMKWQTARDALRERLAQPAPVPEAHKQEPVAIVEIVVPHLESVVVRHILDAPFPKVGDFLYTRPQTREWVGLTDEEIGKAFDDYMEGRFSTGFHGSVRAIEAKLKEKNGF